MNFVFITYFYGIQKGETTEWRGEGEGDILGNNQKKWSGRLPVLETFHTWHTLHSHYSLKMKIQRYKTSITEYKQGKTHWYQMYWVSCVTTHTGNKNILIVISSIKEIQYDPLHRPHCSVLLWRLQLIRLPFNLLYSNWEAWSSNLGSPVVKNIHFERCKACQHLGYALILCMW